MPHRCFLIPALGFALTALGQAPDPLQVTDFESLQRHAQALALLPYEAPRAGLDPFFEKMNYDEHRSIRFIEEKALFFDPQLKLGQQRTFRVEFFHPGWMFKKPVTFFQLAAKGTEAIGFDTGLFDYGERVVPEKIEVPSGYAGFRVIAPDTQLDRRFEFLVFMGASYFRAVTTELGYGISARGLAVNTIGGKPEEFPDFTHFWLQPPSEGDDFFTCYALLNGPSVTGAYKFSTMPGKTTEMFVTGTVYLRRKVNSLGIAPFSSMFWYGENSHPKPYDFRPEVHDSDGLQMELANGQMLWRPLDVNQQMGLSVFDAPGLKGFGLAERDRDFKHFQDLEAKYHRRPGVWVEPIRGFEDGQVTLLELSTGEETWDNIVAFWSPKTVPEDPKTPVSFEYRLSWLEEHIPGTLAKVEATRRGFVMDSEDHLYVIDFSRGMIEGKKAAEWVPGVEVKVQGKGGPEVLDQRVMRNEETGGWRAFFKVAVPKKADLLEMSCELTDGERVISERWLYQWRR